MINPNELRFGNVVLAPTLTFDGVTMMPTILSYFNEYDATLAQPIQLTPEILENCGFDLIVWNGAVKQYFIHITKGSVLSFVFGEYIDYPNRLDKVTISTAPDVSGSVFGPVKYLHQLQNLYFALTGTELDVSKLFQPEGKTA